MFFSFFLFHKFCTFSLLENQIFDFSLPFSNILVIFFARKKVRFIRENKSIFDFSLSFSHILFILLNYLLENQVRFIHENKIIFHFSRPFLYVLVIFVCLKIRCVLYMTMRLFFIFLFLYSHALLIYYAKKSGAFYI